MRLRCTFRSVERLHFASARSFSQSSYISKSLLTNQSRVVKQHFLLRSQIMRFSTVNGQVDSTDGPSGHMERIRDQFTRQAVPFSTAQAIANEASLNAIVNACDPKPDDTLLDVACGGGLVVCAFAPHIARAVGIDITEAMIARARDYAKQKEIPTSRANFLIGDALNLPFFDNSFSLVTTRFSFHHFTDPLGVLREMKRVCKPGGKVCVVDMLASTDPIKAAAFNRLEVLRDNSHHRALSLPQLKSLFSLAGLPEPNFTESSLNDESENLLKRSFPKPEDIETIRRMFRESVDGDKLGMRTRLGADGKIYYSTPVAILVSTKS